MHGHMNVKYRVIILYLFWFWFWLSQCDISAEWDLNHMLGEEAIVRYVGIHSVFYICLMMDFDKSQNILQYDIQ
jgi:hypothetical protein